MAVTYDDLKQEINKKIKTNGNQEITRIGDELIAPAGKYITQEEEKSIEERLFITRCVAVSGDEDKWRLATEREVEERNAFIESLTKNNG